LVVIICGTPPGWIEQGTEFVSPAVKQLIALPADTINARFGLPDKSHGLAVTVAGDVSLGLNGLGFVYTAQDAVAIGLGVTLEELAKHKIKPYALLQRYLNHPSIAPLIAGGRPMEYGAHLIPRGGMMPPYTDGVWLPACATMVNAFLGNQHGIIAGKEAAETAIEAHQRRDFGEALRYKEAHKRLSQGSASVPVCPGSWKSTPTLWAPIPAFSMMPWGCSFPGMENPRKNCTGTWSVR
jgi:flavin-dependent dehydrogenase